MEKKDKRYDRIEIKTNSETHKKTVGIVTFHTADNYGAVLQAYALQTYIRNTFNYHVRIIDFCTPELEREHIVFKNLGYGFLRKCFNIILCFRYYFSIRNRIDRFAAFRHNNLTLTKNKFESESDFLENMESFDYYISGSDQVFNPHNKYYKCYYLGFNKGRGKKISYASSFGVSSFTDEVTLKIKDLVSDFEALSCRENDGAKYLSSITGTNVPQVCDPIFLLSKDEWSKIAKSDRKKSQYIFVYDLNGGQNLINIAKKISRENNDMQIICATVKNRAAYRGVNIVRNLGPIEFLSYIQNASYVITDSFHGTAFSYIFKKRVISYIASKETSNRIISLADYLGTQDQVVTTVENFNCNIKYHDYRDKMESFICRSKKYLSDVLK